MPSYLFVGDAEVYYPTLGRYARPGDVWDGDVNPDPPHFDEITAGSPPAAVAAPETPATPAGEPAQEG